MRTFYPLFLLFFSISALIFHSEKLAAQPQQKEFIQSDVLEKLEQAITLYEAGLYASSEELFLSLQSQIDKVNHPDHYATAKYYYLLCNYELWRTTLETALQQGIIDLSATKYSNALTLLLARHYYRNLRYLQAIEQYDVYDASILTQPEKEELFFEKGYAYFALDSLELAKKNFTQVKAGDTKYNVPATYYYALIAFKNQEYAVALQEFQKIAEHPDFSKVVPYYILQIYYFQKDYDKVIPTGEKLMPSASESRKIEIARILGEAFYVKQDYEKALQYLEIFEAGSKALTRNNRYFLGYVYYKNNKADKAIEHFQQITTGIDSLSQNAYFLLGQLHLSKENKTGALYAFQQAAEMNFYPVIAEEALFARAQLLYETEQDPFQETSKLLRNFVLQYPKSKHIVEAQRLLAETYLRTKNYEEAVVILSKIATPTPAVKQALQRAYYYRGLEYLQNQYYQRALNHLNSALKLDVPDQTYLQLSNYWIAEILYRTEQYAEAQEKFKEFYSSSFSTQLPEYHYVTYHIGYTAYQMKNYDEALNWFLRFVGDKVNIQDNKMIIDAQTRIADCYFAKRTYWKAVEEYLAVIKNNSINVDYVTFQAGLCYGLLERPEKKIDYMNSVLSLYKTSAYVDDALFEKGRTFVQMQEYEKAKTSFWQVLQQFGQSSYYVKTLLELGLVHVNQNHIDSALYYYKRILKEFPYSTDADNALLGLKYIYVDAGNVDEYFQFIKENKITTANIAGEKDSLSYLSAERLYLSQQEEKAMVAFEKYIKEFTVGKYIEEAQFYYAELCLKRQRYESAVTAYQAVLEKPKSTFTEKALLGISKTLLFLKNYSLAEHYFERLSKEAEFLPNIMAAKLGVLRCAFATKEYDKVILTSTNLLTEEKIADNLLEEIYYKRATAYRVTDSIEKAKDDYRHIMQNTSTLSGVEAYYWMVYYSQEEPLKTVEDMVFALAEKNSPYQYWIAKSFLLLGDVYLKNHDAFQAKSTYMSVKNGYATKDDGIIGEATTRLEKLEKAELEKEQQAQQNIKE